VAERPAALLLELLQRDLGGQLPAWHDLVAQVDWARSKGAAVHVDGARLWGCEPFYERSLQEISELFDTVYVSFYKQLGGLPGAALAGPKDVVAEAREWRKAHVGTQYGLFLNAASDLACLRRRFPLMPKYRERALQIAEALRPARREGRARPAPNNDDAPPSASRAQTPAGRRDSLGPEERHLDVWVFQSRLS
jgi:threonine aldolase